MKKNYTRVSQWGFTLLVVIMLMFLYVVVILIKQEQSLNELKEQLTHQSLDEIVGSWIWPITVAMFCVGFLTMSLIEFLKPALRGSFLYRRVKDWLFQPGVTKNGIDYRCWEQLIFLTTYRDEKMLFNLPVENLAGQFTSVSDIVLDNPSQYSSLLYHLAGLKYSDGSYIDYIELLIKEDDPNTKKETEENSQKIIDARNRIFQMIQRNIDYFQISTNYKWKQFITMLAILISGLIAASGVLLFEAKFNITSIYFIISASIIGGYLSTVSRDIVAGIEKIRKR